MSPTGCSWDRRRGESSRVNFEIRVLILLKPNHCPCGQLRNPSVCRCAVEQANCYPGKVSWLLLEAVKKLLKMFQDKTTAP